MRVDIKAVEAEHRLPWTAEPLPFGGKDWLVRDADRLPVASYLAPAAAQFIAESSTQYTDLRLALWYAAVRLEILTGRARACHEETGRHELLDEAESFCEEARAALGGWCPPWSDKASR